MAVKVRLNYQRGIYEIKCQFCGQYIPLLTDRKDRYFYRCRKCDVICFIYEHGQVCYKIKKEIQRGEEK